VMHEDFLRSVGGAVVIGKVNVDHAEARERWEPPLRWWQRLAKRWLGREYGKWVVIHKLVMTATVLPDA